MKGSANLQKFFRRNSSTILTFIGAAGVVVTAVMAAKAAPKASKLLEEASYEKGDELTNLEAIKIAAPIYIPSLVVGVSTIACVFGANILNKRQQAALMSAYALLDNSYKEYRNKVNSLLGEEFDHQVKEEIAKDKYEALEGDISEDNQLFFDFASMQYFEAPINEVLQKITMDDGLECYVINTPFDPYMSFM